MGPSPTKPPLPAAAKPRFGSNFDPWNSSGTGHQRPDNHPGSSVGWRESRSRKLNAQFGAAPTGGGRLSDTWGAGAEDWDPVVKANVSGDLRRGGPGGRMTVADMLRKPGAMREESPSPPKQQQQQPSEKQGSAAENTPAEVRKRDDEELESSRSRVNEPGKGIFAGVVVYVNGSTYPLVSDHKLKQILSENGGSMALHLGRRRVTHVIVGRPTTPSSSSGRGRGAGGGLAGGKMDKEINKIGGRGIKYVGAEWYVLHLFCLHLLLLLPPPRVVFTDLER